MTAAGSLSCSSSEEFDNNLIRVDNCADSLMLLSRTSGALKRHSCRLENKSLASNFCFKPESVDIISTAACIGFIDVVFFNYVLVPIKCINESNEIVL